MNVSGQLHSPDALLPGKGLQVPTIKDSGRQSRSEHCVGNWTPAVQSLGHLYTDWAILYTCASSQKCCLTSIHRFTLVSNYTKYFVTEWSRALETWGSNLCPDTVSPDGRFRVLPEPRQANTGIVPCYAMTGFFLILSIHHSPIVLPSQHYDSLILKAIPGDTTL